MLLVSCVIGRPEPRALSIISVVGGTVSPSSLAART